MRILLSVILLASLLPMPAQIMGVGNRTIPSGLTLSPGWTFLQDTFYNPGCSLAASCTQKVLPTTAGSVWAIQIVTGGPTADKITSANGWTLCPNCSVANAVGNQDAAYKIGGAAGTTSVTVTLASTPTGFFGFSFLELMPPPGYTGSFDTSGSVAAASCTACVGVPLTLAATDAIVQFQEEQNDDANPPWNAWTAPYINDPVNNGIYLNAVSGAAPVLNQNVSGGINFAALAFKSTAGSFTYPPPSPLFSIYSYTPGALAGTTCSPTCTLTIPATQAGDLLVAQAANYSGRAISSMSGAGSWTVPAPGTSSCGNSVSSQTTSCAYDLAATAGVTSLTFTMSAIDSYGILVYEFHRSTGAWSVAAMASNNVAISTYDNAGPSFMLSGSNDLIIQQITGPGFYNTALYYPQPYNGTPEGFQVFYNTGGEAQTSSSAVLLNTVNANATHWQPEFDGNPATMSMIAFK